jgi:hypothetical protein
MTIASATLMTAVWEILQKNSTYTGFFTSAKVLAACQESVDYVAAQMMMATGGGWLDKIAYITTATGGTVYTLPTDCGIIRELRYLVANQYVPLAYDQAYETRQFPTAAGVTQYPSRYRLHGYDIYFNPALGVGGTNYLQVEYLAYPADLTLGGNLPWFDKAMFHYCKYHSASVLAASVGKGAREWEKFEELWFARMLEIVNKRVNAPQYIAEFEG